MPGVFLLGRADTQKILLLDHLLRNFRKHFPSEAIKRISRIHKNSSACPKPVFFSLPNLSKLKIGQKLESKFSMGWKEPKFKLRLQGPKLEVELKSFGGMSSVSRCQFVDTTVKFQSKTRGSLARPFAN